jgi:hypothetical protein
MNASSPGPGWWLASDGNWYAQRWEYTTPSAYNQPSVQAAMEAIRPILNENGQAGWELVSAEVYCNESKALGSGTAGAASVYNIHLQNRGWGVTCLMKRPIAP